MKAFETHDATDLARIGVLVGPPCIIILSAAWTFLYAKDAISGPTYLLLLIATLPITFAGVGAIFMFVRTTSIGVAHMATAAGNIAPPPSYPHQDLLIGQGKYAEAADYFRDHLRIAPEDVDARLRLADLLERHLGDLAGAEQQYLAVRRGSDALRLEIAVTNGLIDVYRKLGRRDRLVLELSRLAERQRGTALGEGAARELRELKKAQSG
ncbi:MAG TPA: tetratricopeptide repeat protein [Gemmatimonadales bacterium]|nr:tetratricopeptide repeat protein [Gemmatimonadales bacterium]